MIVASFQSLLGFLMRCDKAFCPSEVCPECGVSIPAGFSDALRLYHVCSLVL